MSEVVAIYLTFYESVGYETGFLKSGAKIEKYVASARTVMGKEFESEWKIKASSNFD
jgi:hypothetical protein